MVTKFQEEFCKFCKTTSLRGIPRVFQAKSRLVSLLWLTAFLTCFAVMSWQITVILSRYFQYQVNTVLIQAPTWQRPTFPDITVCNLNQFAFEKSTQVYKDYTTNTTYWANNILSTVKKLNPNITFYQIYSQMYFDLPTYLNILPIEDAFETDNSTDIVLDCSYFDWNENISPTDCMATITPIWNNDYYKCYTIGALHLNDSDRSNIMGLSAYLYLEPFTSVVPAIFELTLRRSYASGGRVLAHPPNTSPFMAEGVVIGQGTESTLLVQQTTRQRQPPPYSNCTDGTGWLENKGHAYSVQYCVDTCIQEKTVEECGCLEYDLQFTNDQMIRANYTTCENITQWHWFQKCLCAERLVASEQDDCENSCTLPCTEQIYEYSLSSVSWPNTDMQDAFYVQCSIFNNKRFKNIQDEVHRVRNASLSHGQ